MLASAAFLATKLESLRAAEQRLMEFAARFDHFPGKTYSICPFDTKIPRSVVPIHKHDFDVHDEGGCYRIHGLRVTNDESSTDANKQLVQTPLVFLHGYMNGSAYFYRNFAGLVNYFQCIYSLDLLGWGLSSRPAFRLVDDSVETAEQFFVASLEAWRKQNNIEKMILAGHSMGGYISVAYCGKQKGWCLQTTGADCSLRMGYFVILCREVPRACGTTYSDQSGRCDARARNTRRSQTALDRAISKVPTPWNFLYACIPELFVG